MPVSSAEPLAIEPTIVKANESADNASSGADSPSVTERLDHPTAKPIFLAEVNCWAEKLGVQPTEVRVRAMKSKWGSSTASGRVSFNNELLWQVPSFRRQVIVEELERLKTKLPRTDDAQTE
jgi:predicted metal-dependent hydrolase